MNPEEKSYTRDEVSDALSRLSNLKDQERGLCEIVRKKNAELDAVQNELYAREDDLKRVRLTINEFVSFYATSPKN